MAKVLFKRIEDSANINNIEIEDGSFIVTGDGKIYVDYGEDRIPTSGTPDTEMSDRSRNTVENNVIKNYVDTNIQDIYSTNEIKTHKLSIDNKPISNKTIYVASLPNATSQDIQHNISNVDEIWCDMSNSFIKWNTSTGNSPFNYIGGTSFNSMIELRAFTSTKFTIDTHSTDRSSLSAYITINYTKTTD